MVLDELNFQAKQLGAEKWLCPGLGDTCGHIIASDGQQPVMSGIHPHVMVVGDERASFIQYLRYYHDIDIILLNTPIAII